jgi:hypothetical protein
MKLLTLRRLNAKNMILLQMRETNISGRLTMIPTKNSLLFYDISVVFFLSIPEIENLFIDFL